MELKEMLENLQKSWKELKDTLDLQAEEVKKYGEATGETKQVIAKLTERLDQIETEMNRKAKELANGGLSPEADKRNAQVKEALLTWLRYGAVAAEQKEYLRQAPIETKEGKALGISSDVSGGLAA